MSWTRRPVVATTERKSEMFADAIDALFCPCVETEVFEDGKRVKTPA